MLGSVTACKVSETGLEYWVDAIENLAQFPWCKDGKLLTQLMQLAQSWHRCTAHCHLSQVLMFTRSILISVIGHVVTAGGGLVEVKKCGI